MNELLSLGLILLLALLSGHLVRVLRFPEVTGYILVGLVIGPSFLGWITHENLTALAILSQVALGLILFSIGTVFEAGLFRRIGRDVFLVVAWESGLAALLVGGGTALIGLPVPMALLLGSLAIETAAASTLMVLRELNAEGPLTETLTGILAVNNLLCLTAFSVVVAGIQMSGSGLDLYRGLYPLVWQLAGGAALGYLAGLLLAAWAPQVHEHGEMLILVSGAVLLCVGAANALEVSPMVASLAVGATMANLSARSRRLFASLSQTDPPFYAIFFVIAGADLNLRLLPSMGAAGAVYFLGRAMGKWMGARLAAPRTALPDGAARLLGYGLLAQAGLAIGLTLQLRNTLPALAGEVNTIVLSSVILYEMVGPLSARFAIVRSGEARRDERAAESVLD